jgi:hypothetical protein
LRLFACACCRRILPLLADSRSRRAVQVAERYADARATRSQLRAAHNDALLAIHAEGVSPLAIDAARAAALTAWEARQRGAIKGATADDAVLTYDVQFLVARAAARSAPSRLGSAVNAEVNAEERITQRALFADLFGERAAPMVVDPRWLSWSDGTVVKLARTIAHRRRFGDLPILADALEEAGCAHAAILAHCRTAAIHAAGCWVLDALLRQPE